MDKLKEKNILDTPISEIKFACMDTETTGLSPATGGRLCEIAVLISQNNNRLLSYETLINPGKIIGAEVTKIHGITNEMVANEPMFFQTAPKLLSVLENCVIVCHNADFDIQFIAGELGECGFRLGSKVILDTLKYARTHGEFSKNRLGVIAQELGHDSKGWHRALADAKMTEVGLYHFLKKFQENGAKTLGDIQKLQTRKKLEQF